MQEDGVTGFIVSFFVWHLFDVILPLFLLAVGEREDASRRLHRSRKRPPYCAAAHQEEPGGWIVFQTLDWSFSHSAVNLNVCSLVNQTLQKEIQGHQPRIDDIHKRGKTQSQVDGERQSVLEERLVELQDLWDQLIAETDNRHARLMDASRAQQFYADAAEAEAWMGEQELHMMSEEKAKVREQVGEQGSPTSLDNPQGLRT